LGIFASIDAHCAAFAAEMRRNSDGRSLGRVSAARGGVASMVASGSAKGQIGPVGRATIEVGSAEQSGALAITDHLLMRGRQMHVMSYLREYLFRDEQARQPVRTLSGGERNRLLLAKALAAPSNLLVLDEPTNDLDADTLDLLQEALSDYDGTVLLVSHDRDFLDRLVTSTIALEGDGTAIEYAGGYSDYVTQRGPRQAPAAAAPRKEKPAVPREAAVSAKRLGYKRERALSELPKKIDALHAEIASLHQSLADPDFYRQDAKAFAAKTARLGVARSELEAAETEWLALEILREELKS
jgi:ATP-binding cassette subfamily F protein uup